MTIKQAGVAEAGEILRLQSNEAECPVIYEDAGKLVFHSGNFCPTLEACCTVNCQPIGW